MKTRYREKPQCLAAGLRIILLAIIVLLLLPALAPRESAWPSGGPPTSLPAEPKGKSEHLTPPGLHPSALERGDLGRHLACPPVASLPDSGIYPDITVRPAILGRLPRRCPLPPASAFHLQTNLRKYLETWPTPGSTTTSAWPEYVPEDGEDVD
jgi:hypothetical protein